ncbi:MAG: hypothetical protein KC613_15540 [Myxococcales bacterium]|nr:hypothetical protein [Myxococcales bacterium]MCB9523693.1 hypothetical protein [Myxococcales bacterium]
MLQGGRQLGATERAVLAIGRRASVNLAVAAELSGTLSLERVQRAVEAVSRQHPLVGARVEGDRLVFLGPPPVTRRVAPAEGLWSALAPELDARFDPSKGLARVIFVRHGQAHASLAVITHPLLGDVAAVGWLLRHLLRALVANPKVQGGWPVPVEEAAPAATRGLRGLWRFWRARSRLNRARPLGLPLRTVPAVKRVAPEARTTRVVARALTPAQTKALTAAAGQAGVSLYSAVAAALLFALRQVNAVDHAVLLRHPVDRRDALRPHPKDAVGLYPAQMSTVHALTLDSGFWGMAREVQGQLDAAKARGDAELDQPYRWRLMGRVLGVLGVGIVGRLLRRCTPGIRLALPTLEVPAALGSLTVQRLTVAAAVAPWADLGLFAAAHGGALALTICASAPAVSAAMLEAVADGLLARATGFPGPKQ